VAIFITCLVIAIIFGAVLYPFEISRHDSHVKKIELLLDTIFRQKYEELANEIFAGQKRALALTLKDMLKVEGIAAISIYKIRFFPNISRNEIEISAPAPLHW
jgi:hypothetical protein